MGSGDGGLGHDGPSPAPEGLYRGIVESSAYGYVVVDAAGTITYANTGQNAVTGMELAEVLGRNISEFVHPDDLTLAAAAFAEVGAEWGDRPGEGVPLRLRIATADGGWRRVEVGAQNLVDDADVAGVVLRVRPAEGEHGLSESLAALVSGAALDDVLLPVAHWILWDLPGSTAVEICWDRVDGRFLSSTGEPRPDGLGAFRAELAVHAVESGELVWADSHTPEGDRLETVWAQPVAVADEQACVVVARLIPGEPWTTHRAVLDRASAVVALALERRRSDRMLEFAARHDVLTGLANRAEVLTALDQLLRHRSGGSRRSDAGHGTPPPAVAVIYVDLDGFKPVNDTYGHAAGDQVLQAMAQRLQAAARAEDVVGRLGGDEFAVLCLQVDDEAAARAVGQRIVERLSEPISVGGVSVSVGASAGIAFVAASAEPRTSDQVLDLADAELYAAKRAGGGCLSLTTVS